MESKTDLISLADTAKILEETFPNSAKRVRWAIEELATQATRIAELERLVKLTGPPDGKIDMVALVTDVADKGLLSKALLIVREQRTAAELALSQAKDALKELVACKDLSDRADEIVRTIPDGKNIIDHPAYQEWLTVRTDYGRRKPLAWVAARQFLSTPERA